MKREFNLLDEPWIRVMLPDFKQEEFSLAEVLLDAHKIRDLAGDLPAQDTAVLRLMLAVLHTVFSGSDENGEPSPIDGTDEALRRWNAVWKLGRFPEAPLNSYFIKWHDRFWLFDPEHPFFQVPGIKGTDYTAAKLNGELSESANKTRFFRQCSGEGKSVLSFASAARWLLYVNGYDDTSAKPKQKGQKLPSPGAGWLGKIGAVYAIGENLFETLMLNFTLLRDGGKNEECLWEDGAPVWERDTPKADERTEIPLPSSQQELLTLQSRRLLLKREGSFVTGYTLLGGDFFQRQNAFSEQMTTWKAEKDKSGYSPKRHDKERQMWRDFSAFAAESGQDGMNNKLPGVVEWIKRLKSEKLLPKERLLRLRITGVQYGDKDFFVTDEFSDSMEFSSELLTDAGRIWQQRVLEEIVLCDKVAFTVANLADDLEKASGGRGDGSSAGNRAKEQFYYRLDMPFREWLRSLDPQQDACAIKERRLEWHKTVKRIATSLGNEYVARVGETAFIGRPPKYEIGKHYSAPEAFNFFKARLNKLIPEEGRD